MSNHERGKCECCGIATRGDCCRRCESDEDKDTLRESLEHALEYASKEGHE